jgi:hypothetical protein
MINGQIESRLEKRLTSKAPYKACSAFTHVTACTLAPSPIRDALSEGFSHFVTSMTAPVASGWSVCRVGLAPTGKRRLVTAQTLDSFDFEVVPMVSKAQVMALTAGDSWLEKGANLLLFGPPGGGKSHLAAAIGLALVENGWRVLFMRTGDLVQRLQIARRELALESALAKLDKYHLLILDDIVYVSKDQAEMSVLFELIGSRYERRSMLITANQPFGEWGKVFPDQAITLAAKAHELGSAGRPL